MLGVALWAYTLPPEGYEKPVILSKEQAVALAMELDSRPPSILPRRVG